MELGPIVNSEANMINLKLLLTYLVMFYTT